jgi:nucleoside-diphosphate-sugar epimerase
LAALGVELAVGDMWECGTYVPLVSRVDAVIHAAQAKPTGRWTRRKIAAMHASDAFMTRALAEECLTQDKQFVYTSGAMAHRAAGDEWMDESTPLGPCLMAKGHAQMVQELTDLHRTRGPRVMVLTPGFVYGPGGFLQETVELLRRGRYRVIGAGTNYWSFVHADDLGEAFALALSHGTAGANYFLSDEQPLRRREAVDAITDALGLARVGHVPGWVVALMLGRPLVEAINCSIRIRSERARAELGWKPSHTLFREELPAVLEQLQGCDRLAWN